MHENLKACLIFKINVDFKYQLCSRSFEEDGRRGRRQEERNWGFSNFTYVIMAECYLCIETLVGQGTCLKGGHVGGVLSRYICEGLMGVSVPSLHRKSTDSLISLIYIRLLW